jgi:conjugative transfer signal peptidase TraF
VGKPAKHLRDQHAGADGAAAVPQDRRRIGAYLLLALTGGGLGLLSLLPQAPALIWNFSKSVPVGLYRIERTASAKGDIVVLAPSGRVRSALTAYGILPADWLLLKPIAALAGDKVCRSAGAVTVNGEPAATARTIARDGQSLPTWGGCYVLQNSEVFVLAPHPASFDSRYLGPIDARQIVGVARPLLTLPLSGEAS